MLRYPMTVKEMRDFLIKKTVWDWLILVQIDVDWCFMITKALKKKLDDKVYEDDEKILIKSIKEDPLRLFAPHGWKINMCDYIDEYKNNKSLWNHRHFQKYKTRLYEEPTVKMKINIEQVEKENLDTVMSKLI